MCEQTVQTEPCTTRSPRTGVPCAGEAHPASEACRASGIEAGWHWQLTWWRAGAPDDVRADGLPWPRDGAAPEGRRLT